VRTEHWKYVAREKGEEFSESLYCFAPGAVDEGPDLLAGGADAQASAQLDRLRRALADKLAGLECRLRLTITGRDINLLLSA